MQSKTKQLTKKEARPRNKMQTIIFTLLIGTIFAVACTSSAPSEFQSPQASLTGIQEEKKVQLPKEIDDPNHDVVLEKPLFKYTQRKRSLMQDDDDEDDLQKFRTSGQRRQGWWFNNLLETYWMLTKHNI